MFEMADLWTDTMEAEEYEQFLTDVMGLVTKSRGGTTVWRDDKDVIYAHFNKRRSDGLKPPKDAPLTVCLSRWHWVFQQIVEVKSGAPSRVGSHVNSRRASRNWSETAASAIHSRERSRKTSRVDIAVTASGSRVGSRRVSREWQETGLFCEGSTAAVVVAGGVAAVVAAAATAGPRSQLDRLVEQQVAALQASEASGELLVTHETGATEAEAAETEAVETEATEAARAYGQQVGAVEAAAVKPNRARQRPAITGQATEVTVGTAAAAAPATATIRPELTGPEHCSPSANQGGGAEPASNLPLPDCPLPPRLAQPSAPTSSALPLAECEALAPLSGDVAPPVPVFERGGATKMVAELQ